MVTQGAVLEGTTTVRVVQGMAAFDDLRITAPGDFHVAFSVRRNNSASASHTDAVSDTSADAVARTVATLAAWLGHGSGGEPSSFETAVPSDVQQQWLRGCRRDVERLARLQRLAQKRAAVTNDTAAPGNDPGDAFTEFPDGGTAELHVAVVGEDDGTSGDGFDEFWARSGAVDSSSPFACWRVFQHAMCGTEPGDEVRSLCRRGRKVAPVFTARIGMSSDAPPRVAVDVRGSLRGVYIRVGPALGGC